MENPSDLIMPFDPQTYVEQTAQLLQLPMPSAITAAVVENFVSIVAIAQPVLNFDLPDDTEPASIFQP